MRFSSSKYFFTTRLISLFLFYIRAKCLIFVGVKTAFGVTKIAARPLQRGGKEGFVGCERLFRRPVQVRPNAFPVRHSSPSRLNRSAAQSEQGEEPRLYVEPTSGESTSPGTLPGGVQPGPFPCVVARTVHPPSLRVGGRPFNDGAGGAPVFNGLAVAH